MINYKHYNDETYGVTNIGELNDLLQSLYLEYRNDYLTVEKIAEHKNVPLLLMRDMLRFGQYIHEYRVGEIKDQSPINTTPKEN